MKKRQAKIWTALITCLLLLSGINAASYAHNQINAQTQGNKMMAGLAGDGGKMQEIPHAQCGMAPIHTPARPHTDKCCHVHGTASDIPMPAREVSLVLQPDVRTLLYSRLIQTGFTGADGLPLLRPPRFLNS